MRYRILMYSPDKHLEYDGRTPRRQGIGGGVTARIRMAEALAAAGHEVTALLHCRRRARIRRVQYIPLAEAAPSPVDILIMNTSGGQHDLAPAMALGVKARLRIVWISGYIKPGHLDELDYDFLYAKSNFLREIALREWGVPEAKIFVTFNGLPEALFARAARHARRRDPYRLVYASHPSKGLEAAREVLRLLRRHDERFTLHVYGGPALWAQEGPGPAPEDGMVYHGLVGQERLTASLFSSGFSLNLQNRREPFPNVALEAMRAGCIVVASPQGAYPELVRHGWNGFLISGPAEDPQVHAQAAELIRMLVAQPVLLESLRRNAQRVPWIGSRIARTWETHWDRMLGAAGSPAEPVRPLPCPACTGPLMLYPDGYRCHRCSRYFWRLDQPHVGEGHA